MIFKGWLEALKIKFLNLSQEYLNRKNSGNGYSIHQPQGNKKYGTEKSGFLLKKSDGCVKALIPVSRCQVTGSYKTSIVSSKCVVNSVTVFNVL